MDAVFEIEIILNREKLGEKISSEKYKISAIVSYKEVLEISLSA